VIQWAADVDRVHRCDRTLPRRRLQQQQQQQQQQQWCLQSTVDKNVNVVLPRTRTPALLAAGSHNELPAPIGGRRAPANWTARAYNASTAQREPRMTLPLSRSSKRSQRRGRCALPYGLEREPACRRWRPWRRSVTRACARTPHCGCIHCVVGHRGAGSGVPTTNSKVCNARPPQDVCCSRSQYNPCEGRSGLRSRHQRKRDDLSPHASNIVAYSACSGGWQRIDVSQAAQDVRIEMLHRCGCRAAAGTQVNNRACSSPLATWSRRRRRPRRRAARQPYIAHRTHRTAVGSVTGNGSARAAALMKLAAAVAALAAAMPAAAGCFTCRCVTHRGFQAWPPRASAGEVRPPSSTRSCTGTERRKTLACRTGCQRPPVPRH